MEFDRAEFVIEPTNPFKNDVLDRKSSAEILTSFIKSLKSSFVISIDSSWGTGKTTFTRMWKQHLENEGVNCLYFNAWESDFHSDPLIPLIGEIETQLVSRIKAGNSKAYEFFERAKKISAQLVRRAIPAIAKIASAGVLDLDDLTESVTSDWVAELAKEKINKYEDEKRSLSDFKENLYSFISEIRLTNPQPVVFFVDELDRCRPYYSIELLERIKHLFDIPGFVFVLILDIEQFEATVKHYYGFSGCVDGYLRRFIDLNYQLPIPDQEKFANKLYSQFKLKDIFDNRQNGGSESANLIGTFIGLSKAFKLSLRTQEHCFIQLSVALHAFSNNVLIFPELLAFVIVLRTANKELYKSFSENIASIEAILAYIEQNPGGREFLATNSGCILEAQIACAHADWQTWPTIVSHYIKLIDEPTLSTRERDRCSQISRVLSNYQSNDFQKILRHLVKRVELLEHFTLA